MNVAAQARQIIALTILCNRDKSKMEQKTECLKNWPDEFKSGYPRAAFLKVLRFYFGSTRRIRRNELQLDWVGEAEKPGA